MSNLNNTAIISYGAFRFPVETETTGLSVLPEFDEAKRTVIFNRYIFTIETTLAGRAIDAAVRNVVRQLTKPGYPFIYGGTGLGVGVNIGGIRDAVWGPTPISCDVKPLGGGNAVKLIWRVEVHIPDCSDAIYAFAAMEYNYSLHFSIDASGYTKRTYTGFVRVPMTRGRGPMDRIVPDSADWYREQINPPPLFGFRRTPGEFNLSMDKARLDFSITDEQMSPNIPPPGIIRAEADHTATSVPGKLVFWNCTLNATYELALGSGATFATAREAFFTLLKDRVGTTLAAFGVANFWNNAGGGGGFGGQKGSRLDNKVTRGAVIPVSFSMSEPNIYGNPTARYSCTYQVKGASLKEMLVVSGLYRPVVDGDWRLWQASVSNTIGPRGHANLIFSPGDDAIVDLCGPSPSVELRTNADNNSAGLGSIPPGTFPEPTPEASWLGWENEIHIEANNATTPVVTLPQQVIDGISGGIIGALDDPTTGFPPPGITTLPNVPPPEGLKTWILPKDGEFFTPPKNPKGTTGGTTQSRKQQAYLYMIGRAARVWYGVPQPYLLKWGTAKLTPANRPDKGEGFWGGWIGDVGWPVYGARWKLRYAVEGDLPQSDIPVSQNPFSQA